MCTQAEICYWAFPRQLWSWQAFSGHPSGLSVHGRVEGHILMTQKMVNPCFNFIECWFAIFSFYEIFVVFSSSTTALRCSSAQYQKCYSVWAVLCRKSAHENSGYFIIYHGCCLYFERTPSASWWQSVTHLLVPLQEYQGGLWHVIGFLTI